MEQAVAEYLAAHGLEILDRNYHAPTARHAPSVGAEIDLIARQPVDDGTSTIVFVEVRSRASSAHGSPLETVDRRKQRRIIRAATAWLVEHDLWERVAVRFDVVAVVGDHAPCWIRGAFEA